jgi:hypothetical protein
VIGNALIFGAKFKDVGRSGARFRDVLRCRADVCVAGAAR